jgi:hypothetical protein
MAGDFEVRPSELGEAVSGFQGLIGNLQTASSEVANASAGSAGNARLEQALVTFLSHWGGGLTRLHDSLGDLSTRVADAATQYEGIDSEVSGRFGS